MAAANNKAGPFTERLADTMDATAVALILNATSVALVGVSAWLLARQIKKEHAWNRRKAAHDLVFQAQAELRRLREQLESKIDIYDEQQTYSSMKAQLTKEDHGNLDAILNYLETMCITVHNAVVDEELIYNVFAVVLLAYRRWANPYIKQERSKNPFLWIGLEPYVEAWQARMNHVLASASGQKKLPL